MGRVMNSAHQNSQGEVIFPSKISVFLLENSDNVKAWVNAMPALINFFNCDSLH
jgi:hypothetical protein